MILRKMICFGIVFGFCFPLFAQESEDLNLEDVESFLAEENKKVEEDKDPNMKYGVCLPNICGTVPGECEIVIPPFPSGSEIL